MRRNTRQTVAALLLAYAAYITLKCPCGRINKCHQPHFFLSVGVATAIVVNDLRA